MLWNRASLHALDFTLTKDRDIKLRALGNIRE